MVCEEPDSGTHRAIKISQIDFMRALYVAGLQE